MFDDKPTEGSLDSNTTYTSSLLRDAKVEESSTGRGQIRTAAMPTYYQTPQDHLAQTQGPPSPQSQSTTRVGSYSVTSASGNPSSSPAAPSSPLVERISLTTGNNSLRSQPYPTPNRNQQLTQSAVGSPPMVAYSGVSNQSSQDFLQGNHPQHIYSPRQPYQNSK